MGKVLSYTWRVLVNIFYLAVVGVVLTSIRDPSEKSIVAVLGLIYVTLRSQAIFQAIATISIVPSFQKQIDQIQFRVDGTFEMPDRAEEYSSADTARIKLYIDGFFLGLISLVCLGVFFTAHNN
jgi:hypothetical protein